MTESYEVVSMSTWVGVLRKAPEMVKRSRRDARQGMAVTLERIGAIAETGA